MENIKQKESSLDLICQVVSKVTGLNIKRNTHEWKYVRARWIFFALARILTDHKLSEIGHYVGRDHSSVSHGLKCFERDVRNDKVYRPQYLACLDYINHMSDVNFRDMDMLEKEKIDPIQFKTLLTQIAAIKEEFKEYKREVEEREKAEKPLLDIYRQMPQEQKDRLLFQAKTLLKVSEIMQKSA